MKENHYLQKTFLLIAITFVVRCILAFCVHLGNDESYYFTYALQPDWNHFDHPPLVGIFIRIFTLNLKIVNDFTLRLTSIISSAICTWLIFKIGCLLKNSRAAWLSAVLYNTSIYTSIISGLFILPDSPQLVFWLAAMFAVLKLTLISTTKSKENTLLLLFGLYTGLATMCKIHGVFLWFGFGMYVLLYDRKYLKNIHLYLSFLLFLVIVSPIVFWNIGNHFVTWKFQGERVEIHRATINTNSFLTTFLGQIFYNNPFNIIIYCLSYFSIRRFSFPKKPLQILNWLGFPLIVLTTFIALFRTTLPHWSGPGFISLMIISGFILDELISRKSNTYLWIKASTALVLVITIACICTVNFYPGTLGKKQMPNYGDGDFTLDMYGWNDLKHEFSVIRQNDIRSGLMNAVSPIIIDKWFPACHYLLYVAYPLNVPVIGIGDIFDLHKFAWLNNMEGTLQTGENAYFITSSEYYRNPSDEYQNDFEKIILVKTIPENRFGNVARCWYVFHLLHATHPSKNMLR